MCLEHAKYKLSTEYPGEKNALKVINVWMAGEAVGAGETSREGTEWLNDSTLGNTETQGKLEEKEPCGRDVVGLLRECDAWEVKERKDWKKCLLPPKSSFFLPPITSSPPTTKGLEQITGVLGASLTSLSLLS